MIWWLYYLFASFFIGVFGINKRFGFWGYFFGFIIIKPSGRCYLIIRLRQ
ncbi:hypothetical protein [Methylocucumis oryzae]|nr:hypothetical protein [Methylocucumis oryzae]